MKFLDQVQQQDEESAIDLTPMLDVVFIMLIFFIVTASFLKESGFQVNKPAVQQSPPTEESQSIVVKVMADGQIFIGPRRVDIRAVRPNIERLRAEKPDAPVVVQAHGEAQNDVLVRALDAARLAGAPDVSIAELK